MDDFAPDQYRVADAIDRLLDELGFEPGWTVLDLGCGRLAPYGHRLADRSRGAGRYLGIDLDAGALGQARAALGGDGAAGPGAAGVARADLSRLPLPDRCADLVVCNDTLAYTDKDRVLDEILRVLRPGGACISLVNNALGYTLRKVIHPHKPWPVEVAHSAVVLANTTLFRLTGRKLFHTTMNSYAELDALLAERPIAEKRIWRDSGLRAHTTVCFVIRA